MTRIVISYTLALLFAYSGFSKLINYYDFNYQLNRLPILDHYSTLLVWLIPVLEIMVSSLLFMPKRRLEGFYASFCIFFIFTFYLCSVLNFGSNLPCTCDNTWLTMSWPFQLLINLIGILFTLAGLLLQTRKMGRYTHLSL